MRNKEVEGGGLVESNGLWYAPQFGMEPHRDDDRGTDRTGVYFSFGLNAVCATLCWFGGKSVS